MCQVSRQYVAHMSSQYDCHVTMSRDTHIAYVMLVSDDIHMWNIYMPTMRMQYVCQVPWRLVAHMRFSM